MEYERIHKAQIGPISPSKLRMKLLGAQQYRRKEEGIYSSKTSPSRPEHESAKNSLLASESDNAIDGFAATCCDQQDPTKEQSSSGKDGVVCLRGMFSDVVTKDDSVHGKIQNTSNGITNRIQLVRPSEDIARGYDSGHDSGSSSNFEFHRVDRNVPCPGSGHFSRPLPSKWNDAEKWIVNRSYSSKRTSVQNQVNHPNVSTCARVSPESVDSNQVLSYSTIETKRVESEVESLQISVVPPPMKKEFDVADRQIADVSGDPTTKSVCMRDTGTEMTPIASQDPSRIGTPSGATTPMRSPNSSRPLTPRKGEQLPPDFIGLSEQECRKKTRDEIVALGVKLGKMNIASWASKNDSTNDATAQSVADAARGNKFEFEARAAAWEGAEKSRHLASFKREEMKIQMWECHKKAKYEDKMREVEMQVQKMKAQAQAKMMKNMVLINQKHRAKLAAAETQKNRQAARTKKQVERIYRTGRMPPSHFLCCWWFS